jgi:hypothetical protein
MRTRVVAWSQWLDSSSLIESVVVRICEYCVLFYLRLADYAVYICDLRTMAMTNAMCDIVYDKMSFNHDYKASRHPKSLTERHYLYHLTTDDSGRLLCLRDSNGEPIRSPRLVQFFCWIGLYDNELHKNQVILIANELIYLAIPVNPLIVYLLMLTSTLILPPRDDIL